jgi:ATP-dependent Lhr-like helicase
VHRLRAEIEPVSPADFMRFLFKWQHVDTPDRLAGLDGLREVVAMLDGFELAAAAWERSVLDARVEGYDASMLDMLCLAGEVAWARLSSPECHPERSAASRAGDADRDLPARARRGVAGAPRAGRRS